MKGTQKKERAERDLGFTPTSEIGWRILSSLELTLINEVLKPTEVEFLQDVLFDLSEIKNIVENKITGDLSTPSHPSEESKPGSSSEACAAALDEYLAGARGQRQFNSVARKHNVRVKQLAHHRHQRAAVMKNAGASYSEIERTLGVKAEKLKKIMARHSQSVS